MKWADTTTQRGRIEKTIEPVLSGGAGDADIDLVVEALEALLEEANDRGYSDGLAAGYDQAIYGHYSGA